MRLLDSLFEKGLYVEDLDSVLNTITKYPELIDDIADIVPKIMKLFKNAIHLLYVGESGNLVYSIGFNSGKDYMKACLIIPNLKPKSEHFEIEVYSLQEEADE